MAMLADGAAGAGTTIEAVMGRPPSIAGAVQLTVTEPSPALATTFSGADGTDGVSPATRPPTRRSSRPSLLGNRERVGSPVREAGDSGGRPGDAHGRGGRGGKDGDGVAHD